MKKTILLLAVSILFSVSSFAQVKVSGGFLAGLNLANVSWDPTPQGVSFSNLTGFGFGGVINFGFAGGIGVQAEPMYLQKGVSASANGTDAKVKANYIEIPALLTYSFATGAGQVEPYLMAGPTLGFLLSAKTSVNGTDTDIKSTTSSTDFGATFGAGAKIPAGMTKVFIEARYSLGFSNINNDPNDTVTKIKTKGIQIFAGITFPFGS